MVHSLCARMQGKETQSVHPAALVHQLRPLSAGCVGLRHNAHGALQTHCCCGPRLRPHRPVVSTHLWQARHLDALWVTSKGLWVIAEGVAGVVLGARHTTGRRGQPGRMYVVLTAAACGRRCQSKQGQCAVVSANRGVQGDRQVGCTISTHICEAPEEKVLARACTQTADGRAATANNTELTTLRSST